MSDKQKLIEIRKLCRKERDMFMDKAHKAAETYRGRTRAHEGIDTSQQFNDFIKWHDKSELAETILWIAEGRE